MTIVLTGFERHNIIRKLSGTHLCNNCCRPINTKCIKCNGVGYCSNTCRKLDVSHAYVCESMKSANGKQPYLKALFMNTLYAVQLAEPDHDLFKLSTKYWYVEWAEEYPEKWTLSPITQHQFVSSVSLDVLKTTRNASKVYVSPHLGVLYTD